MRSTARYMKQYGTSYYYATLFFPHHIKNKVLTLYKFVRIPDLVVDNKNIWSDAAKAELERMRGERKMAYDTKDVQDKIWWDSVSLFHENYIPFELSHAFWKVMLQDTEKRSYETYHELHEYMYWSAMVVWEMMCYILWVTDTQAYIPAKKLWEAMQMTNFLRDVKEDREDFGRIYMPIEDLHRFGLSHKSSMITDKNSWHMRYNAVMLFITKRSMVCNTYLKALEKPSILVLNSINRFSEG